MNRYVSGSLFSEKNCDSGKERQSLIRFALSLRANCAWVSLILPKVDPTLAISRLSMMRYMKMEHIMKIIKVSASLVRRRSPRDAIMYV